MIVHPDIRKAMIDADRFRLPPPGRLRERDTVPRARRTRSGSRLAWRRRRLRAT